jgi:hypothetical protein
MLIPALLVDALPERFWWLGNGYQVSVAALVIERCRTVELTDVRSGEAASLGRFPSGASDGALDRLWLLDFGWIAVLSLIIAGAAFGAFRRVRSGQPSGDIKGH